MKAYVIGSGIAGINASLILASHGIKTYLIDETIGGNFLNKTCIPSKILIEASKKEKDLNKIVKYTMNLILNLKRKYESILERNDITIINDKAIVYDYKLILKDKTIFFSEDDKIILCTGSVPIRLNFGFPRFIHYSDELLSLEGSFENIVIIGAGPEGIEIAEIFNNLGSKVTIIEKKERILSLEDEDISSFFSELLRSKKINIILNKEVKNIRSNKGIQIEFEGGKVEADLVFSCIGWKPNTAFLNLNEFKFDDYLRIKNNIFVAGDLANAGVANIAKLQGRIAALNALGRNIKFAERFCPYVINTDPKIASFGLKEKDAEVARVYKLRFDDFLKSSLDDSLGYMKLILSEDGRILGASCISKKADEIVNALYFLSKLNVKIDQLNTFYPSIPSYLDDVLDAIGQKIKQ
jgi:dihydrolipoamide dehydrogenase